MDYKIRDSEEGGGYRIVELSENTKMSLRLINSVINLSSVECDIPELKGICFKEFMKILVKTAQNGELFGKRLSLKTMVELFVSPTGVDNEEDEKKATQKIKSKYAECGFVEEANNVMSASLCVINETVNNGDVSNCKSKSIGKSKSKSIGKSKSKSIVKSYMSSTVSSRSKSKGGKGTKKRRIRKSI
jgi:hypothetical protein